MKIAVIKESIDDTRVAMMPKIAQKFINLGFEIILEENLAADIDVLNEEFINIGCKFLKKKELLSTCDILLKVNAPTIDEIKSLKENAITISFLDPFNEKNIVDALLKKSITSISMQLIERSTIAQKMDALSSQANLAGYSSVILASKFLKKVFPMMTTPSGTLSPAKVFIIGAGVAGLQAIATAKRLGARVEAFDTRDVVEEQIKSLGAKFLKIDLGKTEATAQGYAKELTKEQLEKQRLEIKKAISTSDVVITTAQVFGRKAPVIITKDMLENMKSGSIVIDMAIQSGGNVEGSIANKIVDIKNVKVLAPTTLLDDIAIDASVMYSSNLYNLIDHFYDKETKKLNIDLSNSLLKKAILTHSGQIISAFLK
ncbi:MAG: NAD(P) transhydrogenase subunit alpha part 1 [Candidatus Anoxychlamydiales bacterium]|nr:NAD(P) transhydrogenase subunit alpha part 1 [Candidatus Anoxychlamydiales bacterium]